MARQGTKILDVVVNYPTEENQAEYDTRAARAVARVLINTLPPEKIDELIERLDSQVSEKNHQK